MVKTTTDCQTPSAEVHGSDTDKAPNAQSHQVILVAVAGTTAAKPETPLHPDEVNRLWQHGMHEERLFHDRLNYFSAIQVGLLGVFAILYNKEPSPGVFAPLTAVGLTLALLWLRASRSGTGATACTCTSG